MTLGQTVSQVGIFVFGMSAIWLANDPRPGVRKFGSVCGLIAQPFWYYTSWTNAQWGIFLSSFFYSYSWARGFYWQWMDGAPWLERLLARIRSWR